MSARVQSSPFRETEFDQRLDRMLDDLKNTVTDDEDSCRRTPLGVRSSSRSSSRAGSIGKRGGGSYLSEGVADAGRLTHHRKEYTSPDQHVRTVADTYQYDSGDTHPSGNFQKKVVKSTYSSYNVDGGLSSELQSLKRGPSDREMEQALSHESRNILNSSYTTKPSEANEGKDGRSLSNGRSHSNGHFDDDMVVNDEKGGEVRRIVWRNRYEKTYEAQDDSADPPPPTISIERDAKNRRHKTSTDMNDVTTISSLTRPHVPPQRTSSLSPRNLQLQYAVYWPGGSPNISPGGQSWAEPVPLPTPPNISPREPGVAYIYNYGSSGGSAVQPLPPLNYVAVAPGTEGAPSPTPSGTTSGQPVIYHYSYHYTIQPGQNLPEGALPPSSAPKPTPPALQVVPPPATGYSHSANSTNLNKSTNITEVHQRSSSTTNKDNIFDSSVYPINSQPMHPNNVKPLYPNNGKPLYPNNGKPVTNYSVNTTNYLNESHHHPFPISPSDKRPSPPRRSTSPPVRNIHNLNRNTHDLNRNTHDLNRNPHDPNCNPHDPNRNPHDPNHNPHDPNRNPHDPNRNITININKTTTQTTRTTSSRDGQDYPGGDGNSPLTSTPYRGRSNSPPDRGYRRYPSGPSDSLDRVRRTTQPGMPFPETSPVKTHDGNRIPRKVDDLLSEFPERQNGGPYYNGYRGHPDSEPLISTTDVRNRHMQQTRTEVKVPPPERNEINTVSPSRLREEKDKTKNLTGPPVYYPPGHEQFSESMHTMTLKEGGRRGNAKWRREAASGHKESSSNSDSKGGMTMVPLCLPLCCGAACSIM